VHEVFSAQYVDFLTAHQDYHSSLITQLRKSHQDPANAGSPLRRISSPQLAGRLYKLWVRQEGFRYVYLFLPCKAIVLPIWISRDLRAKLDWDGEPWEEITGEIMADLNPFKKERFLDWTP